MNIAKVLEVLGKHIIEREERLQFKEIEIENLKNQIERLKKENEGEKI